MKHLEKCRVSGQELSVQNMTQSGSIRNNIKSLIQNAYPDWDGEGYVSNDIVNHFRDVYVEQILREEKGELNDLEKQVLQSIQKTEYISKNINTELAEHLLVGQKIADRVAEFGGSWKFIIIFFSFIMLWMLVNVILLIQRPFDPYPFILLNLVLSCLAAIQAPVIMMSQNRKESRDRLRAENDYQINLKAELEIRQLHEKIDHLINNLGNRLFEVQQIQIEMMDQLLNSKEATDN